MNKAAPCCRRRSSLIKTRLIPCGAAEIFFEPVVLDLEPADLPKKFFFEIRMDLLGFRRALGKDSRQSGQGSISPQPDLVRTDPVLPGDLSDCLFPLDRLQRYLGLTAALC